jgi:hypothetical protein
MYRSLTKKLPVQRYLVFPAYYKAVSIKPASANLNHLPPPIQRSLSKLLFLPAARFLRVDDLLRALEK